MLSRHNKLQLCQCFIAAAQGRFVLFRASEAANASRDIADGAIAKFW
jgi:hypothetical protein